MRRILLTACLLVPISASAQRPAEAAPEPLAVFHWAGVDAAAEAGFAGSATEELLALLDPAAVGEAADRVRAALVERADLPDLAEGLALADRLRELSGRLPVTAWVTADGTDPADAAAGFRWGVTEPAAAAALAADLNQVLEEAGSPPEWAVVPGPDAVRLLWRDPGAAPRDLPPAGEAVTYLRLDVGRAVAMAEAEAREALPPDDAETLDRVLGVLHPSGVEAVELRQFFEGGRWATRLRVEAPAPRRGVAKLLLDRPVLTEADLAAAPADTPVLTGLGFDLGAAWDLAREALAAADPSLLDQLDEQLGQVRDGFGVDVEAGLIRALGTGHVLFQDPAVAGQSMLGLVFTNRLADPAAFVEATGVLIDFANSMVEMQTADLWLSGRAFATDRGGVSMTTVPLPGVAPSWAVADGTLIVGLYPQSLFPALDRLADGGGDLFGNDAFEDAWEAGGDAAEEAGAAGLGSVSFVDLPTLAPQAYGSLLVVEHLGTGLASMASREPVPAVLPPYAGLAPLLSPAVGFGFATGDGSVSTTVTPFPGASLLAGGGGGGQQAIFVVPGLIGGLVEGFTNAGADDPYNGFPDDPEPFEFPPPMDTPPPAPGAVDPPPPSPFGGG